MERQIDENLSKEERLRIALEDIERFGRAVGTLSSIIYFENRGYNAEARRIYEEYIAGNKQETHQG